MAAAGVVVTGAITGVSGVAGAAASPVDGADVAGVAGAAGIADIAGMVSDGVIAGGAEVEGVACGATTGATGTVAVFSDGIAGTAGIAGAVSGVAGVAGTAGVIGTGDATTTALMVLFSSAMVLGPPMPIGSMPWSFWNLTVAVLVWVP